ncbi:MAG: pilus assembly protein N-terminal domain-containing protein [Acidobacteria bacterium]|nr:pilus assembly protein N-terminal domain-containing protein [Acidobacteriota bacterium]
MTRAICFAFLVPLCATIALAQELASSEKTVFVKEQLTLEPGFPVGDVAIGDPEIADFTVLTGRTQLLVMGKTEGRTMLTLWDQKRVKRAEILITVTTREAEGLERDLRDLLKDFPSVTVRKLGESLIIAGSVSSEDDLNAIQKIADSANVQSVVRYVPPAGGAAQGGAAAHGTPMATSGGPGAPAGTLPTGAVEYAVEVLEASIGFGTGSYGSGVQPSGRVLYSGKVQAQVGSEGSLFIPGQQISPKVKSSKKAPAGTQSGMRLKLTPGPADENGVVKTNLQLETNVPYESKNYDPSIWRRATWDIESLPNEPIGIAGADLLAVLDVDRSTGGSKLGKITGGISVATGLPGVGSVPGVGYVGVPVYYDSSKKTQLLMVLRLKPVVAEKR